MGTYTTTPFGTYNTTPTPTNTYHTDAHICTENVTDTGKATQTDTQTKKEPDIAYVQITSIHVYPHHKFIILSTLIQSQRVGWIHISGMTRGQAQHFRREYKSEAQQQSIPSLRGACIHSPVMYSEYSYFVWRALEIGLHITHCYLYFVARMVGCLYQIIVVGIVVPMYQTDSRS